jgi:nucleotide-binding universal stress UspA family protein
MIKKILLAVDDSPPALSAARLAVAVAEQCGAELRAVTVIADGVLAERLHPTPGQPGTAAVDARRAQMAQSVLHYVRQLARDCAIPCEAYELDGTVAPLILEQARSWPADLIVVGRSDLPRAGQPYVGSHTRQVLEFADQPVLVVPHRHQVPE